MYMYCICKMESLNSTKMSKKECLDVEDVNSRLAMKGKIRKSYQLSCLYSKYFSLVVRSRDTEIDSDKIRLGCQTSAKCCLCPITNYIQFTAGTTSNLRKHLKRKHPSALNEIEEEKASRKLRQNVEKDKGKPRYKIPIKQSKLCSPLKTEKKAQDLTDDDLPGRISTSKLNALTSFVIETMQPIAIVSEPSFLNLFGMCGTSFKNSFDSWAIIENMQNRYEIMTDEINKDVALATYVCVTADVWDSGRNSVIVVTAHWLEANLDRKSVALACIGVSESVTLEDVAQHLGVVITKFDMHKKLSGNLTINITTFRKEFNICSDSDDDSDEEVEVEEQEVATILPTESLNSENESVNLYFPNHYHCLSRTLIVIASKDIKPILEFLLIPDSFRSALTKCLELWQKLSLLKSEIATEKQCHLPFASKWNDFYRAVTCVNNLVRADSVEQVIAELEKPMLSSEEIAFTKEFEQVLKPLVMAASHLNGDDEILLAHVLPTINGLKRKLTNVREILEHCKNVADVLLESIEKRFGDCYRDTSLIVASCTHPNFRMRWIPDNEKPYATSVLESVFAASHQTGSQHPQSEYIAEMEDFYGLECVPQTKTELQRFLEDTRSELDCLDCYPSVKEVFRRYNTTIANRTPIVKLFSSKIAKLTRMPKIGNKIFEMQLLLRANNSNCLSA